MSEKPGIIKIRMFGSHDCDECTKFRKAFGIYSIPVDFIDAMADENQELCDRHGVDKLPHIQAFRSGSDDIIYERIGYTSPLSVIAEIAEAKESQRSNMTLQGVRRPSLGPKLPKRGYKGRGCSGCRNAKTKDQSE
tara:strand:+ start:390985 stop:391392 length:408 start_codon:yes stop_codon:yes gene_type:complete